MSNQPVNRRSFGKRLAIGAVAAAPFVNQAQADDKDGEKKPPAETPKSTASLTLELLVRRYPQGLDAEDRLQGILRALARQEHTSRELSDFPLTNADEPAFVFSAYTSAARRK